MREQMSANVTGRSLTVFVALLSPRLRLKILRRARDECGQEKSQPSEISHRYDGPTA